MNWIKHCQVNYFISEFDGAVNLLLGKNRLCLE